MPPSNKTADNPVHEARKQLHKLEKREWWLWSLAVVTMLLLAIALFAINYSSALNIADPAFQSLLKQSVRGIFGLVLIFCSYATYQQLTIKRFRRQFSKKLEALQVLQNRVEEFEGMVAVDSVTGLCNRRASEERFEVEALRSNREGNSLCVAILAIDEIRKIRATYGRFAEDHILKQFAALLRSEIRKVDFASRIDGGDFLVLLPNCSASDVKPLFARLEDFEVDWGGEQISINVSAGSVEYKSGETLMQCLERADLTLFAESSKGTSVEAPSPSDIPSIVEASTPFEPPPRKRPEPIPVPESKAECVLGQIDHWSVLLQRSSSSFKEKWIFRCTLCRFYYQRSSSGWIAVLPLSQNQRRKRFEHDIKSHPEAISTQRDAEDELVSFKLIEDKISSAPTTPARVVDESGENDESDESPIAVDFQIKRSLAQRLARGFKLLK
jgi:diguanylate cyclase (GGDEF)-like protein